MGGPQVPPQVSDELCWQQLTHVVRCVTLCAVCAPQSLALAHVNVAEDDTVLFSTW